VPEVVAGHSAPIAQIAARLCSLPKLVVSAPGRANARAARSSATGTAPASSVDVVTHHWHPEPLEEQSTTDLLRQTLEETKQLARLEVRLAQSELREDVRSLKWAGLLFAIAAALFVVALAMFDLAVVIALGGTASAALIVAGIVLVEVAVLAIAGYRLLPKVPLERTRARFAEDVRTLKEHMT
jgi:hypothetical protein